MGGDRLLYLINLLILLLEMSLVVFDEFRFLLVDRSFRFLGLTILTSWQLFELFSLGVEHLA